MVRIVICLKVTRCIWEGCGRVLRRVVAVLLVLVMLSSAVVPAMAASNEQTPACSKYNSFSAVENKNVAVFALKGLEKIETLAKALKNKDITKLIKKLTSEGYKPKTSKIIASKIYVAEGMMTYVYIPLESKEGLKAGVGYLRSIHGTKAIAIKFEKDSFEINYVSPTGEVKSKSIVIQSSPWSCAECGASITLVILCCAGTSGAACYACVIAGSVLAVCPCLDCCCWMGYSPCCDAAETHCG